MKPSGARAACVAVALMLIAACEAPPPPAAHPRPVRAVRVPETAAAVVVRHPGVVVARHAAPLAFEVPGRIVRRQAEVGDAVTAGQTLAVLDDADYRLRERAARAALAAAQAAHDDARREAARLERLRPGGHVSQAEADRAQDRARGAGAQLDGARAELDLARRALAHTVLRAPHAGVITARTADAGQVVAAGAPVFTLARDGAREVTFNLPEQALPALAQTLTVRPWAQADQTFSARVRTVDAQADPVSRTYGVRATLQDSATLTLGASASVEYTPRDAQPALAVPLTALLADDAGTPAVWVVDAEGRVARCTVTLGTPRGDQASITGGLQAGEWVVTAGVHDLHPGEPVDPQ